jgi:electron transport complex protein RnfG
MSSQVKFEQPPPSAAEMMKIAFGLTLTCLIAAVILGGFYYITEPAKARNLQQREQLLIGNLLGLSANAEVSEIRRYLRWRERKLEVIYLLPKLLLTMDSDGNELNQLAVPDEIRTSTSAINKDEWVRESVDANTDDSFKFGGRFFVGRNGDELAGYVVEGLTPGYKTWIRFFLAIDSEFRLRGLEVIQHEEDPGLGAEITKRYFKNQFAGRSFDEIVNIEVTKDPLPGAWKKSVEELGDLSFPEWYQQHAPELQQNSKIHAITGSTISSVAVADGVKKALRNFRKRFQLVEQKL